MLDDNKIEPHSDEAMGNSSGKKVLKVILYAAVAFIGLMLVAVFLDGKYLAGMVLAAPIGLAAWFFRGKLNAFSKTAVVVVMALAVWLGISTQNQTEKARSLGFISSDEMEKAADAGFSDKASYDKFLLAAKAKAQAEAEAEAEAIHKKAEVERAAAEAAKPVPFNVLSLTFNGRKLPLPTSSFEIFSPPRAYDLGTGSKTIYDQLTDEGELKGDTIYLSPYDDKSWGDPYFDGYKFGFNADGSLTSLMGEIASTQSPKLFREKLAQFCGGTVDQVRAEVIGSYMSGTIETKFAKCTYASEDELGHAEVLVMYKH